jgi:hypothetical protein
MGYDRSAAGRIQLGEDVVEEQHRGTPYRLGDDAVHSEAERQSERPLLAL